MACPAQSSLRGCHVLCLFGIAWLVPYSFLSVDYLFNAIFVQNAIAQRLELSVRDLIWGVAMTQAVVLLALMFGFRKLSWWDLGFRSTRWFWFCAAIGFLLIIKSFFGPLIAQTAPLSGVDAAAGERIALAERTILATVIALMMSGPVTAVIEETVFRGVLYEWLSKRYSFVGGVFLSSMVFSLVHLTFLNPGGVSGWVYTTEIFVGGVMLATLYELSGSIWPSIYMHSINNLIAPLQPFIDV